MRPGLSGLLATSLALGAIALAQADEIHKNPFSGKSTSFIKGEDNVKAEEKAHDLSADRSRSLPTSERIKLTSAAGKNETNYAYYFYPTPAAPITEDLSAELYVHSTKAGVQLLARVVLPKERNPKQIDEPLTVTVLLDAYKAPAGGWQKLVLKRPLDILQQQKLALRLQYRKDVDMTDAYIDWLILNLYAGPGDVEVYLDNLEIGPVKAGTAQPVPLPKKGPPGSVTSKDKDFPRNDNGILVDYERGRLTVGGVKAFPRFIRYSGAPLQVLKEAGFNALYMPSDVPREVLDDAIDNYQFWIIPYLPPVSEDNPEGGPNPLMARDADALVASIRKFQAGDAVLFWDFGPVRSEDSKRVSRTVEAIRVADPKRPVAADVWDGFGKYASTLQLVGTHRDPLLTSLELDKYSSWLNQRKVLASGSKFTWTWVQTHLPEWQAKLLYDKGPADGMTEPFGPQPEQIRLLTYLAMASGCKGLGFWSDRFLADSQHGKDRMLQLMLLNQEIEMLEPILLNLTGDIRWVTSSHPSVRVAILRSTGKGLLALPIWLGGGAQYVPPQGAVSGLTFTVPLVPDGAEPWEISPVRVQSLQNQVRHTPEGIQITLPDFDLTAAVVFTSDNAPDGQIAQWQKHTRRVSRFAASWACDLAAEQLRKVVYIQGQLDGLAPPVAEAGLLIREAEKRLMSARRERAANNDEAAYFEAIRSLRPMRILMRAHWEKATKSLDYAAASPYAVSFYTLPRHWELARSLRGGQLGASALNDGDFETARPTDRRGVAVTSMPGWTVQNETLDEVVMEARVVPSAEAEDTHPPLPFLPPNRYAPTSLGKRIDDPVPPRPTLGANVLRLKIGPKPVTLQKSEKPPPEPQALERVFLAVNSPPVRLPPGSWVRISGWVKLPGQIRATADGALFYDTTAGEAYAVRLTDKTEWKQFHLYRKVPASGEVRVRMALTGFGTAYFDDIRVEPIIGAEARRPAETTGLANGR